MKIKNFAWAAVTVLLAMATLARGLEIEDGDSKKPSKPLDEFDPWAENTEGSGKTAEGAEAPGEAADKPKDSATEKSPEKLSPDEAAKDVKAPGEQAPTGEQFNAVAKEKGLDVRSPYAFRNDFEFAFGADYWSIKMSLVGQSITDDMKTMGYSPNEVDFVKSFDFEPKDVSVMPIISFRWDQKNAFTISGFSFSFDGTAVMKPNLNFGDYHWDDDAGGGGTPATVTAEAKMEEVRFMYYLEYGSDKMKFSYGVGLDIFHWKTILTTPDTIMTPAADLSTMVQEFGHVDKQDYWVPLPTIGFRFEGILGGAGFTGFVNAEGTWVGIGWTLDYKAGVTWAHPKWPHLRAETGYRGFEIHADGDFKGRSVKGDINLNGPYANIVYIF